MEDPEDLEPPASHAPPVWTGLLVFGFGALAGVLLAFAGFGFIDIGAGLLAAAFLVALILLSAFGLLALAFRRPILRRLFGFAETQLEALARPISRIAERAAGRDPEGATAAARELVQIALSRYSWITTRRWIVTSLTALIAAMAALAGTALLFQQNELLKKQSDLLEEQNRRIVEQTSLIAQDVELAEAARNAQLAVEITQIAAALGAAAARAHEEHPSDNLVNVLDATELDRALILRITSVSQALRPYRFLDSGLRPGDSTDRMRVAMQARRAAFPGTYARMATYNRWSDTPEGVRLIDRPSSPERGHLLAVLAGAGVRGLEPLNVAGLDLSFARLQDAVLPALSLQGGRLAYADFSGAALTECDLGGAVLENARFHRADIRRSTFADVSADRVRPPLREDDAPHKSFLTGADFSGAFVRQTDFSGAWALATSFDDAVLDRVVFSDTQLGLARFPGAVLIAPDFTGAGLKSADFDGAVVFGADALERIATEAEPGSFRADRYRLLPMTMADVMALPLVNQSLEAGEITDATGGAPPYRVERTAPFDD